MPPARPGSVWVHGASVGEIGAAEALLPHLDAPVLLTADTDTGARRARDIARSSRLVVAGVRPVDHPWTLAPLWADARPRAVVFVEGTWWPQLAARAVAAGVPVVRVSARAGARTRRWARRWWYRPLASAARLTVCQDEDHARWFAGMGLAAEVGGDLKGDRPLPPNPLAWERPFVVGASTRPGEEEALLEALDHLPGRPQLLLAPRHPDRFDAVAGLLRGRRWVRRSELSGGAVPREVEVVLLDTLGELAGCLRGAAAAFVGGTFDAGVGGHSPAEAARAGVPVAAGPQTWANASAFAAAGPVVAASPEGLAAALAEAMALGTMAPWSNDAGSRTAALVARWLDGPPAPEAAPRPWAWPVGLAWMALVGARNLAWERARPVEIGVPVISVGSANARGPGKTSTTRWLARELESRGHRPGIALRGYRRVRRGGDVCLSTDSTGASELGDEGAVLAGEGLLVGAGADRAEVARALALAGATVVLLDDGLQHRRLHRDLDLVVVDARFPRGRGPLPAGERREWEAVPRRADAVIVHHLVGEEPPWLRELEDVVPVFRATRRPGPWHHRGREVPPPEGPVAALAGIGRAADFHASLEMPVDRWRALPDHAPIGEDRARELRRWTGDRPLVCTAKDAVRMPSALRDVAWWRDVEVEVAEGLVGLVEQAVARARRGSGG